MVLNVLRIMAIALTFSVSAASRPLPTPPSFSWRPDENTPPPSVSLQALRFDCPFPEGVERHIWDAETSLDLSEKDGLLVEFSFNNPDAFRSVTLYLRSGPGWYAASFIPRAGHHREWLPLSRFEALDAPSGWKNIEGIRLSPWNAGRGAGAMTLHGLLPLVSRVAVLRPSERSSPDMAERDFGQNLADQLGGFFADLSLPAAQLADHDEEDLSRFSLLILPLNPQPDAALIRRLERAVRNGSRLMVFYNADPALAELAGVKPETWTRALRPGQWMAMRFEGDLPGSGSFKAYQRETPHLIPLWPGKDGRVAGWWENAEGNRQSEPALVLTPTAAWFSAPFTREDESAKLRMLAYAADALIPGIAHEALRNRVRQALDEPGAADDPRRATLETLFREKAFSPAWELAGAIRADTWLRAAAAMKLLPGGMRGVWDHSGNGLHAGRWDRTAPELASAGFSDVFVFVSRSAAIPSAAVEASASVGMAVHAWHICWKLYDTPAAERERLRQEGRLQVSAKGDTSPWLCPSHPDNRREEKERLLQLAGTPGLRGLHLDYMRWPDTEPCVCANCLREFTAYLGHPPAEWPSSVLKNGPLRKVFFRWRAELLSSFVEDISKLLREKQPELRLSAAVWPGPDVVERLGQDWISWLREGWLDFAVPMSYSTQTGQVEAWTRAHVAAAGPGRIVAGLGVTASESRLYPPAVMEQIAAVLKAGADGFVLFDLNQTLRDEMFPVLRRLFSREPQE